MVLRVYSIILGKSDCIIEFFLVICVCSVCMVVSQIIIIISWLVLEGILLYHLQGLVLNLRVPVDYILIEILTFNGLTFGVI